MYMVNYTYIYCFAGSLVCIKSVVWETPDCSKSLAHCVLKPLENADQEPLLEFFFEP